MYLIYLKGLSLSYIKEMLEAINIHKVYTNGSENLYVLKGINLYIDRGSVVSILGPSGAGKSTLLHILGGLDRPTDGRVIIDGLNLYTLGDRKRSLQRNRKIGFVFQFYHLLPELNILENVLLPAMIGKVGRYQDMKQRAFELLKDVGLTERIKHRPSELSAGERQRVAVARAIMNMPDLLLCDEPTGNLDSKTGSDIIRLLKRLNKEMGMTILSATHNKMVAEWAEKVIYIKDGILQG